MNNLLVYWSQRNELQKYRNEYSIVTKHFDTLLRQIN
jgi:hypothetical protein